MSLFKPDKSRSFTKTIRSKKRVVAEAFFGFIGFTSWLFYWENNVIETTRFERFDKRVPSSLDGLTIVQISDLHGKRFGRNHERLLAKVRAERPDIIVITGDLLDERSPFPEFAREVVSSLRAEAPVFYVTGNHEGQFVEAIRPVALAAIESGGAYMLDNRAVELSRDATGELTVRALTSTVDRQERVETILLAGVPDPETELPSGIRDPRERYERSRQFLSARLSKIPNTPEQFYILLSHRPEQIATYASHGVDLVFTGHAHGGQFRVPFLLPNGLFAPHQGFFPKYACGRRELNGTTELTSRGLGPSVIPTRIFNRPNLVVCKLRRETQ